ncbi:MAG: cysteine desulfurase family protein [Erysipelotrichaceae bacterium]
MNKGEYMKKIIYVDNAATTALNEKAYNEMIPYLREDFGNPSGLYTFAREPRRAVNEARSIIANCIGAEKNEVYFTSGGTESDNWAIKGTAFSSKHKGKHIITTQIEHHAVLNSCKFLESQEFQITYLPVDEEGLISTEDLQSAIRNDTVLISIMLANNEIGTIENIKDLVEIAHNYSILFHTDAVQAVGHIGVNVKKLNIDLLSASAHKFNGPKGTGFLYISNKCELTELLSGGEQENGKRSGTENVAAIVGMAVALKDNIENLTERMNYVQKLKSYFLDKLSQTQLNYIVNGCKNALPGTISLSFKNVNGEALMHRLDLKGIEVSTGSACDSHNTQLSHVIKAINVDKIYANGTIRISISHTNDFKELDFIVESLTKIIG